MNGPNQLLLDTRHFVETPEGVELSVQVAGPIARSLAWLVDLLIRLIAWIVLGMILAVLGDFGMGLLLLLVFAIEWFYPVLFEVLREGATPGKSIFGIKAVHDDGTPIGWRASLLRNLLRAVDFLPVLYGFGLISVLATRDFKRLGDLVAGTVVVYRDEIVHRPELPEATPTAPPVALSVEEQAAVLDFAERATMLPPERVDELASLARPLTHGNGADRNGTSDGNNGARKLLQMAAWGVGRR